MKKSSIAIPKFAPPSTRAAIETGSAQIASLMTAVTRLGRDGFDTGC